MKKDIILIHALDNEVRLKILRLLVKNEGHVCYISKKINKSQPVVSTQLSKLNHLGIVDVRREGNKRCYYLIDKRIKKIIKILDENSTKIKFNGGKI